MSKYRYNKYIQLIKPPSPSLNLNSKKIIELLRIYNNTSKILDLGCGNRRLKEYVINFDIIKASNIDVVGDAQFLPFSDETFDFIICQALLEHVKNPKVVSDEIYRILKRGGTVYIEIPFLKGFHADPNDYTRLTLIGIESLLYKFKRFEIGACIGPFSTLTWWFRKFPTIIFGNTRLLNIVEFISGWFTFWIKYFDILIIRFKNSHILAGGLYYLGEKNTG